jgi:glycosyltransferase involved in cell wall biosynthesis
VNASTPRLTVGLPVHNGAAFLADTLDALLAQTFTDFELIIADNASTDATPAIAHAYLRRDGRLRYVRQARNVGAARNFNDAFRMARGPYFKWAAADDRCAPTFFERCVAALDADPTAVVAAPEARLIHEDGSPLAFDPDLGACVDRFGKAWPVHAEAPDALQSADPAARYTFILLHTRLCHEVFGVVRADALRRTSLIGPYYGSDKVLLAELSLLGRFARIPEPLFLRRCHRGQSGHQTVRARETWIRGSRPGSLTWQQGQILAGYVRALRLGGLRPGQHAACAGALLRYQTRPEKLKQFLLPGPENFLGLDFGAARPPRSAPR